MSDFLKLEHEAMKTTFAIRLRSPDPQLTPQIVGAAFQLIDDIEDKLSRYRPGSDVWQINHMQADESLFVCDFCYDCLRQSLEAFQQTRGLFDITLGKQIEHKKNEVDGDTPGISGKLMVDPEKPAVHCTEAGREIDLGGIGKGFALDKVAELLKSFGVQDGLVSAGASTQLAFGDSSWPIRLGETDAAQTIQLKDSAFSASGTGIQGSHIVFPDLQTSAEAAYASQRVWVLHESAAMADAWSTAAMFIGADDLQYFDVLPAEMYLETGGGIKQVV